MNKIALFAATAAAVAMVAPATAATVVYETGSEIDLTIDPVTGVADGEFLFRVTNMTPGDGNFTATFTFDSPFAGLASADASNSFVGMNFGEDIDFTSATLNGQAGTIINSGGASFASIFNAPAFLGTGNILTFSGLLNPRRNGTGNADVTGSLNIAAVAAVPEPATWAMFILGFGVLGAGLRRRNAQVSATKARLTFA